jgi:hypothetical protein
MTYDEERARARGDTMTPNHIETWFERDRAYVGLYVGDTVVLEWWDEAVFEAVEDGFLNPRDWLGSAEAYAHHIGVW